MSASLWRVPPEGSQVRGPHSWEVRGPQAAPWPPWAGGPPGGPPVGPGVPARQPPPRGSAWVGGSCTAHPRRCLGTRPRVPEGPPAPGGSCCGPCRMACPLPPVRGTLSHGAAAAGSWGGRRGGRGHRVYTRVCTCVSRAVHALRVWLRPRTLCCLLLWGRTLGDVRDSGSVLAPLVRRGHRDRCHPDAGWGFGTLLEGGASQRGLRGRSPAGDTRVGRGVGDSE